ncbi:hypothetical protein [Paracoccus marcusii]|uniref:hypothetical protein n=1 Tax=Paracoccus marcusii TaxID=59779 RepID=UPI0037359A11
MTIVFEGVRSVTQSIRWLPSGLYGFAAGRGPSKCMFEPFGEPTAAATHRPADEEALHQTVLRDAL